jgi:hypothetical protein
MVRTVAHIGVDMTDGDKFDQLTGEEACTKGKHCHGINILSTDRWWIENESLTTFSESVKGPYAHEHQDLSYTLRDDHANTMFRNQRAESFVRRGTWTYAPSNHSQASHLCCASSDGNNTGLMKKRLTRG